MRKKNVKIAVVLYAAATRNGSNRYRGEGIRKHVRVKCFIVSKRGRRREADEPEVSRRSLILEFVCLGFSRVIDLFRGDAHVLGICLGLRMFPVCCILTRVSGCFVRMRIA